ncbi:hypothetical protein TrRE_jg2347 [Triparma retinervis]|uniref:TLDc domain-containing protein n=1 Tax=Triparma retinervis TaxID=2557542 RepID=A0A9W7ASB1_9STRA|nr:hypothetical protein TrRE_jg2347 [Triparma retinervis]
MSSKWLDNIFKGDQPEEMDKNSEKMEQDQEMIGGDKGRDKEGDEGGDEGINEGKNKEQMEKDPRDPIEKLFNFFFGDYPCTKDSWAVPLPNDSPTSSTSNLLPLSYLPRRYRPMLKNTNMESRDMVLTYSASSDGWDPLAFHSKLDRQGACLVVALTSEGQVCGGYNPKGWCGYGEYRGSVAAFLFTFSGGEGEEEDDRPVKLRKVGGAGLAQLDFPEAAVSFGSDSFVLDTSHSDKPLPSNDSAP